MTSIRLKHLDTTIQVIVNPFKKYDTHKDKWICLYEVKLDEKYPYYLSDEDRESYCDDEYLNNIRNILEEVYEKVEYTEESFKKAIENIDLVVCNLLLKLVSSLKISVEDDKLTIGDHITYYDGNRLPEYDINIDPIPLIYLLQNKDYIIYDGKIYYNREISNFSNVNVDACIVYKGGYHTANIDIVRVNDICYSLKYLREITPHSIKVLYGTEYYFLNKSETYKYNKNVKDKIIEPNSEIIPMRYFREGDIDDIWLSKNQYDNYINYVQNLMSEYDLDPEQFEVSKDLVMVFPKLFDESL